jgi:NAD(P)H-flavin reductase
MQYARFRALGVAVSAAAVVATAAVLTIPGAASAQQPAPEIRTLDGSNNNLANPDWGRANTPYLRVAPANYADGIQAPVGGPAARRVSNRVFNDSAQNVFSENGVTQWGFAWGQFMDHTFGLRQELGGESRPLAFDSGDPLENFIDTVGGIPFNRTPAAPGTGTGTVVREQINTVSSYIDGFSVYGGTEARLEWLREGPVDGNLSNNGARLLLGADGLLPRRDARGNAATAPAMDAPGRLAAMPGRAMVAGDARANENVGLTATHALFAREHNRIVDELPGTLSEEEKFQIARRVVGAEQQYITYTEFLPTLGVTLSPYRGYNPSVNASLSNEFAVVGYRAHSMIHGELEPSAPEGTYTPEQLAAFEAQGIEVEHEDGEVVLVIPLVLAFGNPDLLANVGLAPLLKGLGGEPQYKNDEQIDNQLRSVLFQLPIPGNFECLDGPTLPECFRGVVDLGAIDIERARDHGLTRYNQLRQADGLAPKKSMKQVTGESTDRFQNDREIDRNNPINDPDIIDFVELFSLTLHPFSFSSSAERDEVEIAVKALGDFSSRVHELEPGTTVYVDGPHGVFSMDQDEGPGFGFIAGGVGITGLISMLRTMADRDDLRPAVLVYANRDWEGVAFRDELERLEGRPNISVVHVLEQPPADWTGESGYVSPELLSRHLPRGYRRFQFFICGPEPMMDAAETALVELGVPAERVHTERFDMV